MYMKLMDLAVVLFICSFAELPHQINLWSLYLESGESHCADKLVKSRFPANTAFNMQLKICTELTLRVRGFAKLQRANAVQLRNAVCTVS